MSSSKLDYFTIGVVALCIVAIIFLLFKMTDLLSNDEDPTTNDNIENVVDTAGDEEGEPGEDENIYDYDLEEEDSTLTDESNPVGFDDEEEEPDFEEEDSNFEDETIDTEETTPVEYGDSSGKYLVIAGSFSIRANAESYAKQLQGLGYENASSKIFDGGRFAVVLVDRYDNYNDAKDLVTLLKKDGIEAYVQNKKPVLN